MGLLVRLRHALGERVLELPDRTVDDPLVVGRAGDADIQIPSINVAPRQVVLFVHEGHWVVQDAPGGTGTLVNGAVLSGARVLRGGDVLTLGNETNAPTIQVDPAEVPAVEAAAHAVRTDVVPPERVPAAHPTHAAVPPPPLLPAVHQPPAPEPEPAGDDLSSWMNAQPTTPTQTFYTPKRRKSSDATVAFAVVASLAIVAGAVAFVYLKKKDADAKQMTVVPPAVKPNPTTGEVVEEGPRRGPAPTNMFNDGSKKAASKSPPPPPDPTDQLDEPPPPPKPGGARPNVTTRGSSPRPVVAQNPIAPVPENQLTEPMDDPEDPAAAKALKDWKAVESAYYNPNVGKALMAIDSYAEAHPGSRGQQIDQFREDLLDKLWWDRIADLLARRKELTDGIKKTEQAMKDETEDAFKKTVLEPRLEDQKSRVAKTTEKLEKEMKYAQATPPPLNRDSEMRKLREARDAEMFKEWKTKVLLHIRQTRGTYPWANER